MNRYIYACDDPMSVVDPTGHFGMPPPDMAKGNNSPDPVAQAVSAISNWWSGLPPTTKKDVSTIENSIGLTATVKSLTGLVSSTDVESNVGSSSAISSMASNGPEIGGCYLSSVSTPGYIVDTSPKNIAAAGTALVLTGASFAIAYVSIVSGIIPGYGPAITVTGVTAASNAEFSMGWYWGSNWCSEDETPESVFNSWINGLFPGLIS